MSLTGTPLIMTATLRWLKPIVDTCITGASALFSGEYAWVVSKQAEYRAAQLGGDGRFSAR